MKIKEIVKIATVIVIAVCLAGCGSTSSSSSSGDDGLSESEALALSEQIAGVAVNSMNSIDPNASVNQSLGLKTVQCSQDGSTCTYNIPISFRQSCTAGGRIEVTGSITGSTSNGSGLLQISAQETITDWECITGFIINGDPYISLSGTFSFMNGAPSTQQTMTITGGFKWGTTAADSCQIYVSINFNPDGSGTMTGSVCGYSVDASF